MQEIEAQNLVVFSNVLARRVQHQLQMTLEPCTVQNLIGEEKEVA